MNKQAISVTLDPSNVVWFRAQTIAFGCRSVSEVLDQLIYNARTSGQERQKPVRSVVGTLEIADIDPDLSTADAAVRALFPSLSSRQRPKAKQRAHAKNAVSFLAPRKDKRG
jgi:hypothetical protein